MTGSLKFFFKNNSAFGLWTVDKTHGWRIRVNDMSSKFWVRSFQQRASMVHFVFFYITDTWELCLNNCASASASAERLGLAPPWQYYSACVLFSFYCFSIFYSIGFHVLVNIICDTSDLINFMNVMSESLVWLNFMSTRAFLRSLSFLFEFLFAFPKSRMIWSWKVAIKPSHSSKLS